MANPGDPSNSRRNTKRNGLPYASRRGMQSPLAVTTSLLYSAYLPACSRPGDPRHLGGMMSHPGERYGPREPEPGSLTIGGAALRRRHSTPPGPSPVREYGHADEVMRYRGKGQSSVAGGNSKENGNTGLLSAGSTRASSLMQSEPEYPGNVLSRRQSSAADSPLRRASSTTSTAPSLLLGESLVCRGSLTGGRSSSGTGQLGERRNTTGRSPLTGGAAPPAAAPAPTSSTENTEPVSDHKPKIRWPWKFLKKIVKQNDQISMVAP